MNSVNRRYNDIFFTELKRVSNPFLLFFAFLLSAFLLYIFLNTFGPAADSPSMYGDSSRDYIFEYICSYDLYSNNCGVSEAELRYNALLEKADYYISHDLQLKNLGITCYSELYLYTQSSASPLSIIEKEKALTRWFAYLGDENTSPLADHTSFAKRALSSEDELTRVFCILYAYDNTYNVSHYEGKASFGDYGGGSLSDVSLSQQFARKYNYDLNFQPESHLPARTYVMAEKYIYCISATVLFMLGFLICFKKRDTNKAKEPVKVTPLGKYKSAATYLLLSLGLSLFGFFAVWEGWLFSGIGFVKFINCELYSYQILSLIPKPFFNIQLWCFGLIQSAVLLIIIFSFCLISFSFSNAVRNKALCFSFELVLYAGSLFVLRYYFWDYKQISIPASRQPVGYIANFTFDHSLTADFLILASIIITAVIALLISFGIKPFKYRKKRKNYAGI